MTSRPKKSSALSLRISSDVVQQIRRHARSSGKTEVCGVLIGSESDGVTSIEASIAGENAAQGGAHVTFTQDTWEHIYKIKDREHPDARIVGWYHSHPGFGVFLSDHDTFIHKNFFSSPQQVAWVYDPHSDEEGCFGWRGQRLERLPQFAVVDEKGGQIAGETRESHPQNYEIQDSPPRHHPREHEIDAGNSDSDSDLSRLARAVGSVFFYLAILAMGFLLAWYVFPRIIVIPVDPYTGRPLRQPPSSSQADNPSDHTAPSQNLPDRSSSADQTKSDSTKANDGHK